MYYVTVTIFSNEPAYQRTFEVPGDDVEQALDRMKYFAIGLIIGRKFDFKVESISGVKPRRTKVLQLKEFGA